MNEEKTEEKLVKEKLEKNEKLTKIKQEFTEVKLFMENLNKNLKVEVLVPIAENLAFFKGLIKHTNECTIYLGDDYYAQTVNKKAVEIIDNRLKNLEKILAEDQGNIPIETIIPTKEKESEDTHYKNLRKLDDGTIEIFEDINEFPQSEIVSCKTVQVSQEEKEKIKLDREKLWQEKLKRMKVLAEMEEAEERNETNEEGVNYKQNEASIKSPKDIYNLMTTVRKENEVMDNDDKQKVIQIKNNNINEEKTNVIKEINPEVKNTKKTTKKKDIITTGLKLGSHKEEDVKIEKRSLFFEEDQNN